MLTAPNDSGSSDTLAKLIETYGTLGMTCVELGTREGHFTSVMAPHVQRNNGHLYTVDWYRGSPDEDYLESTVHGDILVSAVQHMLDCGYDECVTLIVSDTIRAARLFQDQSVDFLFIDSAHRYSHVSGEISAWWPKLRAGGIMCGHDYDGDTYEEEFVESDFSVRHHGVIKAVNEFMGSAGALIDGTVWGCKKKDTLRPGGLEGHRPDG